MIEWMQGNSFTRIATFYTGNITLNTPCIQYFESIKWCLIGVDREKKIVAIKLVDDKEYNEQKFDASVLNKVSVGKSYVRISNKNIIKEINKLLGTDSNGDKFLLDYDEKEKIISINVKKKA